MKRIWVALQSWTATNSNHFVVDLHNFAALGLIYGKSRNVGVTQKSVNVTLVMPTQPFRSSDGLSVSANYSPWQTKEINAKSCKPLFCVQYYQKQ